MHCFPMYCLAMYRLFGYPRVIFVTLSLRGLSFRIRSHATQKSQTRAIHVLVWFRLLPNFCCFGTTSSNPSLIIRTMATTKKPFERLPTNVAPKNYALTLQPNLTEFTFTGKEVIDVEVMKKNLSRIHKVSLFNVR